jgi:putative phosphoribosyl transferase
MNALPLHHGDAGLPFVDRVDAGRRLGAHLATLAQLRNDPTVVIVGLPRGGVPVAEQVALALGAPLDVILVRKLGMPYHPELGMGAVGEDGVRVLDDEIVAKSGVTRAQLELIEARERSELARREDRVRGAHPRIDLTARTVVVVDDGIATGSTARAACQVARAHGAAQVVLAVPVAPPGWEERLGYDADELVALSTPAHFGAIGQFYVDFSQLTDEDVLACLTRSARQAGTAQPTSARRDDEVAIAVAGVVLRGTLTVPGGAIGIVLFAHGSGSSRHSPRNRYVASILQDGRLGTLLLDLLTVDEADDRALVFDVRLLASRLTGATEWLRTDEQLRNLPVGYFGASTGAAAALCAAAEPRAGIAAIVSRGGRPDLAAEHLAAVRAPTLLIVGGHDGVVLDLNRRAHSRLGCESRLVVIPGATHLFEEPGALESVAGLARDWFTGHMTAPA